MVTTTRGDVDEATLQKTEHVAADTDDQIVTWTEYCERDCPGAAHRIGIPVGEMYFCDHHIHHSVHVYMKRWPLDLSVLQGSFE